MQAIKEIPILTVSQVTRNIKDMLEREYRFVRIRGEISNLKTPFSGHSYFTLKDSSAQLRAVLFKQQKRFLDVQLADGQNVFCFGRITVYEPRGEYQLIVDSFELAGTGDLQIAFARLKEKLAAKGYFAEEKKQPLPVFPQRLAVISSPTGAAIQDFLKIVALRQAPVHIQIVPVRMQGDRSAQDIARAIELVNSQGYAELIVLCRGGGSLEDLWSCNEEMVADAIYRSTLPVVTGIGHETDYTIADFCADYRCPTPTAAAQKVIFDAVALRSTIAELRFRLIRQVSRQLALYTSHLNYQCRFLGTLEERFRNLDGQLQLRIAAFQQAIFKRLDDGAANLKTVRSRLLAQAPNKQLKLQQTRLANLIVRNRRAMCTLLGKKTEALGYHAALLNSISPLAVLGRGYSITRKFDPLLGDYQVVKDASELSCGDRLNILLARGEVDCQVQTCHPPDEKKRRSVSS